MMTARISALSPLSILVEPCVSISPSTIPDSGILYLSPSLFSVTHPMVIFPSLNDPSNPAGAVAHFIDVAILLIFYSSLNASL